MRTIQGFGFKKSKRRNLDELATLMPILNELEQGYIVGGSVEIKVTRSGYGTDSTMSTYVATAYDCSGTIVGTVTGYFIEPVFDPTKATTAGSNTAIQAGNYNVTKRSDGKWELENVPGRSNVQIHTGNTSADTTGCFLTANSVSQSGSNYVIPNGQSTPNFNDLKKLLEFSPSDGITISITNG